MEERLCGLGVKVRSAGGGDERNGEEAVPFLHHLLLRQTAQRLFGTSEGRIAELCRCAAVSYVYVFVYVYIYVYFFVYVYIYVYVYVYVYLYVYVYVDVDVQSISDFIFFSRIQFDTKKK